MARTCCCRQPWQLRIKKSPATFLLRFCVQTSHRNAYLLVLFHRNGECCSRSSVLEPSSSLTLWAGPRIFNKRRVYGLPHAMYVAMFHCTFCKTLVRAIRVHFGFQLAPSQLHAIANTFRNISVIIAILARQQQQPAKEKHVRTHKTAHTNTPLMQKINHTKQHNYTQHHNKDSITDSTII